MADITIVNGGYKPTYNWGAPSCIMGKYEIVGIQFIHSYSWWVSELSTIKKWGIKNMISPSTNGIFRGTIMGIQWV